MDQTTDRVYNVLFLCTGNSARSIIAESVLNASGKGRFKAYGAGSYPSGAVNPLVLEFLRESRVSPEGAQKKSWDEFAFKDAPDMDFVITVCDQGRRRGVPGMARDAGACAMVRAGPRALHGQPGQGQASHPRNLAPHGMAHFPLHKSSRR
jgi:protein-tyrosine-phosphatase